MRGLEALERLWLGATNPDTYLLDDEPSVIELKTTIENELKVVEMLRHKTFEVKGTSQEEYDLLKEVIYND